MVDMQRVAFRALLEAGQPIGAAWLNLGNLAIVEAAAQSGVEAVVLDLQHGHWDRQLLEGAVCAAGDTPLLVRVADNAPVPISEALDAGAEGVIVPSIETADEAARAVALARFPPYGRRSGGGVRPIANGFGEYVAACVRRTMVGIMIETAHGLNNLHAILAVKGVDFIFIGTGDLAVSLARAAGDDDLEHAFQMILNACAAVQIPCGLYTRTAEEARRRASAGYRIVVTANDIGAVTAAFAATANTWRRPLNEPLAP